MKRSPLKRKTWMRRSSKRLQRRTRIKPRNAKRAAQRERTNFGSVGRYVRLLRCCVCGKRGASQAAHYITRGSGKGKARHLVPLCWKCHRAQEGRTEAFERAHVLFDLDGAIKRGFSIAGRVCETLAEVASYVVELAADHDCLDHPEKPKGRRARCYVCRRAFTKAEIAELAP